MELIERPLEGHESRATPSRGMSTAPATEIEAQPLRCEGCGKTLATGHPLVTLLEHVGGAGKGRCPARHPNGYKAEALRARKVSA